MSLPSNPPDEPRDGDVAIVGMACRVPGATDIDTFWRNLCAGTESITFFTRETLLDAGVPATLLDHPDYVRAGAVLDDIDRFDAGLFDMSAKEAALTDPQQRILLECAWTALEHAGYAPSGFGGAIGCYLGAGMNGYLANNVTPTLDPLEPALGYAALIGNSGDFLSTRISYKLGLRGPSVTVQTACSTSLVAVHAACQALLNGECDLALAGGVSVRVPHLTGYLRQEGMIFSPDGHVRAFDARAQGMVAGSGAGIVVLQRLSDAQAKRATVHAVIRGSAINNDGSLKAGYTAPSVDGQARVIAEAQRVAEIEPETIGYIEAHGTGTDLGDPIEVAALSQAFGRCGGKRQFCGIGSVKTNLGHLDAAAGIVGLIKTTLALRHRMLPPSLNFERPNPKIDFAASPFRVVTKLEPWTGTEPTPRRAGVSAFGIGGTNAHVVLEEAPSGDETSGSRPWQILPLSARTPVALDAATEALAAALTAQPDLALADVAATLACGRTALPHRRIAFSRGGIDVAATESDQVPAGERPVAFMFPGQGAQYIGMGQEAYRDEPGFRVAFDRCAEILAPLLAIDLRKLVFDPADATGAAERLAETALAQPALFAVEYAFAQQWLAWGVQPEAMIGHSLGEYVAACLAGVFELDDALALVVERGRLMQALPAGAMLAVPLAAAALQPFLPLALSIAAINAAEMTVISGSAAAIDAIEGQLRARGVASRKLQTSHAFHSAMMEPMLAAFHRRVAAITLAPPRLRYVSNLTGDWIREEEATDPGYWVRHLREPVRFADGLAKLLEEPQRLLLDLGPGRALGGLAARHPLRGDGHRLVSVDAAKTNRANGAMPALTAAAGRAWLAGAPLDWAKYFAGERRRLLPLPTYAFDRQRYWIDPKPGTTTPIAPPEARRADIADWFYALSWRRLPPALGSAARDARRWVIVARHGGAAVMAALVDDSTVVIRPEEFRDHLAAMEAVETDPVRLIFMADGERPDEDLRALGELLDLVRAIYQREINRVQLVMITVNAVRVIGDETLRPVQAALHGLLKVLRQEHPNIECRAIDLSDRIASGPLRAELVAGQAEPVVALRGEQRWAPDVVSFSLGAAEAKSPACVKSGGVYLIVGGFGGIGFAVARYLAATVQARLVLVGRSELPRPADWDAWLGSHAGDAISDRIGRVRALIALGAEVASFRADLDDAASIEAAMGFAVDRFGNLDGVVLAAGEHRLAAIIDSDRAQLQHALRARLAGLAGIARAAAERKLDFVVVMSSLSALLGAIGLAAYTAIHAAVDAFVEGQERSSVTRWIAIDWDNWRLGDAPTSGVAQLSEAEGIDALRRILAVPEMTRIAVSTTDLAARLARWVKLDFLAPQSDPPAATSRTGHARPALATAYLAPASPLETRLVELWQGLLGYDRIGVNDNFFELGADSILGVQFAARATQAGIPIVLKDFFTYQTVAALAAGLAGRRRLDAEQGPVMGKFPPTAIQRWFFDLDVPRPSHFNQSVLLETRADLDPVRLADAVRAIWSHHDLLRARVTEEAGDKLIEIDPPRVAPSVAVVDLAAVPAAARGTALQSQIAEIQSSLDLMRGPLLRATLFRFAPHEPGRLLIVAHHLVVDLHSWRLLISDLHTAYEQRAAGAVIRLAPKTTAFKHWAEAVNRHAATASVVAELPFWLDAMAQATLRLKRDDPRGANLAVSEDVVSVTLDATTTSRLLRSGQAQTRVIQPLLAALSCAFGSWLGRGTLMVELEGHGRDAPEEGLDASRTVGWFTAPYPVVLDIDPGAAMDDMLAAVGRRLAALPAMGANFAALRYVSPARDRLNGLPKAEIVVLYLGKVDDAAPTGSLFRPAAEPSGPNHEPMAPRPYVFELNAMLCGDRLQVDWRYGRNLHRRATIEALARNFAAALTAAESANNAAAIPEAFADAGLTRTELDALLTTLEHG